MKPYYEHAGIRIYHGDCREFAELSAEVLITDPPYPNNSGHFDESIQAAEEVVSSSAWEHKLVFWSERAHPPLSLPVVAVHIWHRTNVNGKIYEPCYEGHSSGTPRRSLVIRGAAIFEGAGAGCCEYLGHPTQKPVHVMAELIRASRTTGVIIDPFCGSGSTLRAAKDLNREAIGIELEERYCEIAARRLEQEVFAL